LLSAKLIVKISKEGINLQKYQWKATVFMLTILMTACGKNETAEDLSTPASVIEQQTAFEQYSTEVEMEIETESDIHDKLIEKLYDYEVKTRTDGSSYAVITGFHEDYAEIFQPRWEIVFPEQLGGAVVTEFAPNAFQNIPLGNYSSRLKISPNIVSVGVHCFENCGLTNVTFEKQSMSETASTVPLTIHERAFADNSELWGIYFSNRTVTLEKEIFVDCAETGYLCYETSQDTPSEMADSLKTYAEQFDWNTAEIPNYYSSEPIVNFPDTPLTLTPEVGSFFYGENAEDNDQFCSFEHSDDAPDYGFPEWHIPCGEFCAMAVDENEINASSTLSSADGKYSADNLAYWSGREHAWAEGVEGSGIGESIRVISSCGYNDDHTAGTVIFLEGDIEPDIYDGYMRYTQICIVNGYAKNEKIWKENGRVKRLLMCVEDHPYAYLELEDIINPQYFKLPFDAIKAADSVEIHFQFTIEEVYAGTKYDDTCLTGLVIDFMGRRGH
jgi:hypothetical protein